MTSTPEPRPPRVRPRWLYRAAFVFAAGGFLYLLLSGRLLAYFGAFKTPLESPPADFQGLFNTALLWLVFIAPLTLLSFELGMQHTTARRLNRGAWRGLAEAWRIAWGRRTAQEMAEDFAETPDDDVVAAVLAGIAAAALPPAVFLTFMPAFRTPGGIVWISGTGVLFGIVGYCHRRAAAYLEKDPSAWSWFRNWSILNPSRYAQEGRRFVYAQIVCTVILPMWWLGGGILFMARRA